MSLQKYLHTIEGIDPGKIYVENVRSVLGLNRFSAQVICEMAVRENVFKKRYGVVCPNFGCGRIIQSFGSLADVPEEVTCEICEDDERQEASFKKGEFEVVTYYQLNR